MSRIKQFLVRTHYIGISSVLAVGVLIGSVSWGAQASADTFAERSVVLSTSTKAATGVSYTVNFTAVDAAGAFVVDFCSDSPVIGDGCTAPAGFDASSAASTTTGVTNVTGATSQVIVTQSITASQQVSTELTGITNPSAAGPMYVRVVSYDSSTNAANYQSAQEPGTGAVDEGSMAVAITDEINISGRVLESMTFCVSGAEIGVNCAGAGGNPPVVELGETVGSTVALQADTISTGDIYTQLSTNAAGGATISLKSDAAGCGGLLRSGAPSACDIQPALDGGITAGEAKFGLMLSASTGTTGYANPTGVLQPVSGSFYNTTTYALNYVSNEASGITSVYGDPLLDTNGQPVDNQNVKITFGASVANNTPGGQYSTNISLIATGRF